MKVAGIFLSRSAIGNIVKVSACVACQKIFYLYHKRSKKFVEWPTWISLNLLTFSLQAREREACTQIRNSVCPKSKHRGAVGRGGCSQWHFPNSGQRRWLIFFIFQISSVSILILNAYFLSTLRNQKVFFMCTFFLIVWKKLTNENLCLVIVNKVKTWSSRSILIKECKCIKFIKFSNTRKA